ncbi:MAG: Gfo/Idh/MocA family oxidoreductase [Actinobacteria bacterium]|nr:Gfo/Idh/MocA family oxidoreductase [Actinomycetota bacterium]
MAKDKLGVGLFGMGWVAGEHIKGYMNNPKCEIKALASRKRESAEKKKALYNLDCDILDSYDDLLKRDDIDIISMCSPNFLRAEEIIKACEAGKHIFAEKPIVHNLDELKAVKKAYEEAKAKYKIKSIVGFVVEYYDQFLCIKSLIEKGAIGVPFFIETDYWHELGPWWPGWAWAPYTKKGGSSVSMLAACHAIGVLMRVGGEVSEVHGYGTWGHRMEYEYPPTITSSLKFKNGAIGNTGGSFEIECPYTFNIIIHGTKGSIENEKFFTKEIFAGQEDFQTFNCTLINNGDVAHHPFRTTVNAFVDDILNNVDNKIRLDFAIPVHEVGLAIDRSVETGETVKLPILK